MVILAVICHVSRENVRRIRSGAATFALSSLRWAARSPRDERHDWPASIRHAFQVDAEPNLFSSPLPITKARLNLNPPGADYLTTRRLLDPDEVLLRLETRLGPFHAQFRLGMEREHEAQAFGQGLNFLHLENLPLMQVMIEIALRVTGTYWRGRANAREVQVRRNLVRLPNLPRAFDGFTVLHLSDLHADLSGPAMQRAAELAHDLAYDLCVLTGDYRGRTHGDWRPCLEGVARLCEALRGDIYAVLGNHDSIAMVPDLEALGIRMLLNECIAIDRGGALIYLAGVDDAHFYRADNIEKAAAEIPQGYVSVLLSHTPEIYRQAAHAGFALMLSGHTHGGQICLPGGIPILLEADLPRAFGAGAWQHAGMAGYTSVGAGSSVVPVRFNNRPEITLHQFVRGVPQ